jgi:hypothetical protein
MSAPSHRLQSAKIRGEFGGFSHEQNIVHLENPEGVPSPNSRPKAIMQTQNVAINFCCLR